MNSKIRKRIELTFKEANDLVTIQIYVRGKSICMIQMYVVANHGVYI